MVENSSAGDLNFAMMYPDYAQKRMVCGELGNAEIDGDCCEGRDSARGPQR